MKRIIPAVLLAAVLSGCRTTELVEVPVVTNDTLWHERTVRDSIHVRDSVRITVAGDTVTIDRWHDRWRDRIVRDTIRQTRCDTVTVVRPAEPLPLTWWQQSQIYAGRIALTLAAAALLWLIVKLKFKL